MSMHDLGILSRRLIEQFPEYYTIFAETEFDYKDRSPANRFNRNPLLKLNIGADGLKTGHTKEAGYGLVGSAVQGGRRVIFVITGLETDTARAEEAERITNWAFRQFVQKTVAKAGQRVAEAEVWMGNAAMVGLVPAQDISLLVPAQVQEGMTAEVVYSGPLMAPLAAGQQVAELIVHVPDLPDARIPLVTEAAVGEAGFLRRMGLAATVLYGRLTAPEPAPAPAS
jgi:D-alanyl-D-alanine carboxypeptidase (penicillin-binding protein 5/6)